MARLDEPVMNTRRRAPASKASSTAYWMSGLSTMGSISFGLALVAGRKRVPRPATGNTATSMRLFLWEGMEAPAVWGPETYHAPTPGPARQGRKPLIVCVSPRPTRLSETAYPAGLGAGLAAGAGVAGAPGFAAPGLSAPNWMSARFLSMSF